MHFDNPCGCDEEDCGPCGEFWTAVERSEADYEDRMLFPEDYL